MRKVVFNIPVLMAMLLLATASFAQSHESDKRLSLNYQNVPLEEVLNDISRSANVSFSYSSNKIPIEEKVVLNVQQETLENVLKQILKGFPVEFQVNKDRIILRRTDMKQTVRGKVFDNDSNSPVIGATVVVLNTDPLLGATTDFNGGFRIENVPVGRQNLRVQSVGYVGKDIPNVLVSSGKETVLEVKIQESITQMKEIVVNSMTTGDEPLNELAGVSL